MSKSKKSLVYGVGVNDSTNRISHRVNGKCIVCPFYSRWSAMLARCYDGKFQERNPTYIGCSVCEKWKIFSNFKLWMVEQDWNGNQLDKDILAPGNRMYSPETCAFVSASTNSLLNDRANASGFLPGGVLKHGRGYRAQCKRNRKTEYLGTYDTPAEARAAYLNYKAMIVIGCAELLKDKRVSEALILAAERMSIEAYNMTKP